MFEIIQETALPKLSSTSLYVKFNQASGITSSAITEIKKANEIRVDPKDLTDIIALMRLNGDSTVKKAINAYLEGRIFILFDKTSSTVPVSLPYLIMNDKKGQKIAYIFADKVMTNIDSSNEYRNLMAVLEATYMAMRLMEKPNTFTMNRQLMLTLCNIYTYMVIAPLEQKLYIKGDNLTKAMLYVITYFYRMIDGDNINASEIPFKRITDAKLDIELVKQIVEEVKNMPDMSFLTLLNLIVKINPVRYKDLPKMYVNYFYPTCGASLIFALENLQYLFLLVTSAEYKSSITAYGINKAVGMSVRKAIALISSMSI